MQYLTFGKACKIVLNNWECVGFTIFVYLVSKSNHEKVMWCVRAAYCVMRACVSLVCVGIACLCKLRVMRVASCWCGSCGCDVWCVGALV